MSSAICFNLDQFKLSSGNGLKCNVTLFTCGQYFLNQTFTKQHYIEGKLAEVAKKELYIEREKDCRLSI